MNQKTLTPILTLGLLLSITGCTEEEKAKDTKMALANPASVNCAERGGTLRIATRGDGGQYGICYFEDNLQCEEWALMRGNCPVGGIKVTGYTTPASTYCAVTGGKVIDNETKCVDPSGVTCEMKAYFDGDCPKR